ncbi:MAG: M67 family metallopeptidase [Spirochaetales bacterium]|jgi:proteasome lid subunit RPN8/RPN11|nr:M67 family metallopeptidase [Spirochaetales bacterium]
MIRLDEKTIGQIRAFAEAAYPNEACGFLLGKLDEGGRSRQVEEIIPIDNAREAGEQYHRFTIEPEDFMRAEKTARGQGREVLGFYHSHPDHPALPSDYDREHALPFYSYIIVAVAKGAAGDVTSWELSEDRKEFTKEDVEIWQS